MALITAAEARAFIPGLSGTGEDTAIDTLIAEAGALIGEFCGAPPASSGAAPSLESTTYTLYGGEGVEVRGQELHLAVPPVVSITSIYDSTTWTYGASDLVTSTDYVLDGIRARVILIPTATHAWSNKDRGLRVICIAGYPTVPAGLKLACIELVQHLWNVRYVGQALSVSSGGTSIQFPDDGIPAAIRARLLPFRLMGGCAA